MNRKQLHWLGFGVLLAMLFALGCVMVPAHWTSIWMDMEFTDWISPIANRLQGSARLYDYGMHTPMPPLAYVLLHLLHPDAIWIQENRLNFICQAGTLLLLYLCCRGKWKSGLCSRPS